MLSLTQNKININFGLAAFVLIVAFLTIAATTIVSLQFVSAQNSSNSSNPKMVSQNSSSSKNASSSTATSKPNKTATTVIVTGAKASTKASTTAPSYNRTGFSNLSVLTINGKNFPIKYSIKGGKLVGMLADSDRSTLVLVLSPGKNGGNMTIELPRNVIDSKGASNGDTKYQLKIDGKGVDYKEVANNAYARVLSINFSKDNRFMEIIGTKTIP